MDLLTLYSGSYTRRRIIGAVTTVLLATLISSLDAEVIIVGHPVDSSTASSIQGAIDKASQGDTIRVSKGNYLGNILIKTDNITVEGIGLPIIQGEQTGSVVTVAANHVTFKGFNIRGGGRDLLKDDAGIKFLKAKECLVTENRLEDNLYGMYLSQAEHCVITNNIIRGRTYDTEENRGNGIHTWDAPLQ